MKSFSKPVVSFCAKSKITIRPRATTSKHRKPPLYQVLWIFLIPALLLAIGDFASAAYPAGGKSPKVRLSKPAPPSNLAATGISTSQIALTWTDSSGNEEGFKIEQSLDGTSFKQIAKLGSNATAFTAGSLKTNTTYYFRVRAYNRAGNSAYSNTAAAKTFSGGPAAPSNLQAATASSTQIGLSWADNSDKEDGFKIEQSTDGTTFTQVGTVGANVTSFNANNLQVSTTYYYRVRAYNSSANSAYSNTASATTFSGVPAAPSNLTATSASQSQIDLAWADNSQKEDGLKIEQSNDGTSFTQIATTGADVTSYSVGNLQAGTTYHYRVRAFNSNGDSSYSNTASAQTGSADVTPPANLAAAAVSSNQINLSWTDTCEHENGFQVEQSMDGQTFQEIGTTGPNATGYSASNLKASTKYFYRVRSFSSASVSDYSGPVDATTISPEPAKVYPGAVGFATQTPGGRGGAILKVTNLNNSGPGSLRAAVEATGRRTVVFEVSGTIYLETELKIRSPYLTIAGQTAPSPGITIAAGELNIKTHDVFVQHIRVRIGDQISSATSDIGGIDGISADGEGANTVVFDHVSVSWAIDENASSWYDKVHDVTFSNCIISEALNNSIHPKGAHSMGLLITPNARNVSVLGNLLIHNSDRNPLISNGSSVVLANNVMYNWKGGRATNIGHTSSTNPADFPTYVSVVGNVYIGGNDTPSSTYAISAASALNTGSKIYYNDILTEKVGGVFRNLSSFNPVVSSPPIWLEGFTPQASEIVESSIIAFAGARPVDRDAVDNRIIGELIKRTGRVIDSQSQVGGLPFLPENYRAIDVPADANEDDDNDGYTNFEETVLFPMAAEVEGRL